MDARIYRVDDVRVEGLVVVEGPPAISISARGTVNSTGWTNPRLAPWTYVVEPSAGVLDLDFIAAAPSGYANFVEVPIVVGTTIAVPSWVRRIRVHSSSNAVEAWLDAPQPLGDRWMTAEGLPLPWPFPWSTPPSAKK